MKGFIYLADVFEGPETLPPSAVHDIEAARARLWTLIDNTPNLDWLLLTKRPEHISRFLPELKKNGLAESNIWLGTSVGVRKSKSRIDELRSAAAKVRFLSLEPLLENLGELDLSGIHWVILGGESGPRSRRCELGWMRSVMEQCRSASVPVFVKQLGASPHRKGLPFTITHKKGGDISEFPIDLQLRQFPAPQAE
jgi:protein gp37